MEYIVIDDCSTDLFLDEYETEEQALRKAERTWNIFTAADIERRTAFYVIKSVNPDEEAENHLDGDVIKVYK